MYEFNSLSLKSLTNKLSKESNKEILLLGDVNIDLIKTNTNNNASEFLDIIYSGYLIPHITSPTRLASRSHTLIDNIISNVIPEDTISGNIINTISDHLGQFLILPYHSVTWNSKQEILHRNFKNFSKNFFLSDLKKINWESLFSQHKQGVNIFYKLFLDKITHLVNIHAPITKLSIKEKKELEKPPLIKGILQSIKLKNIIYHKFIRSKETSSKEAFLQNKKFKYYKNLINKLTRINKSTNFYKSFFGEYKNDSKKTWGGIRSIINI